MQFTVAIPKTIWRIGKSEEVIRVLQTPCATIFCAWTDIVSLICTIKPEPRIHAISSSQELERDCWGIRRRAGGINNNLIDILCRVRFSAESIKVSNSENNTRTCLNPWWDPNSMNVVDDNFMVDTVKLIWFTMVPSSMGRVMPQCVYDQEILYFMTSVTATQSQLRHAPPWCRQIKHWCIISQYRWHQDGMSPETSWIAHAHFHWSQQPWCKRSRYRLVCCEA